ADDFRACHGFLRGRGKLLKSTAISSLFVISCATADAQETVIDANQTLDASGNPYGGIQVTNGAVLEGNGLIIGQSSNGSGLLLTDGDARLSGGSISQSGTEKYISGVE